MLVLQLNSALTMDGVSVVAHGIEAILREDTDAFRGVFRRGHVYNNDTRGVHCDGEAVIPWLQGPKLMEAFKGVSEHHAALSVTTRAVSSRAVVNEGLVAAF